MEFMAIIFLICRSYDAVPKIYLRQLIIYAAVYLPIIVFLTYDVNTPIILVLANVFLTASLVFFVRKVFNKKIALQMFMNIFAVFLILIFFQIFYTSALAVVTSREVERTFDNGLIVMGSVLISSFYLYTYVDVVDIMRKLKESKKHLLYYVVAFATAMLGLYVLTIISYAFILELQIAAIYIVLTAGTTFLIIIVCTSIITHLYELRAKKAAVRKYMEFEKLPQAQRIKDDEFDKHLEVLRWLTLINDDEKTNLYIKEHLNNYEDEGIGFDDIGDIVKLPKLDNQPLAAYLFTKVRQLRVMGIKKAKLNIWNYDTAAKIKTYKLMEVLDILVDEVVQSTDKNNAFIRISVRKESDGRPSIEISNINDSLPSVYALFMDKIDYSLKANRDGGLFRLKTILQDYDCEFYAQCEEHFNLKIVL